jgi:hypothetical protein
MAVLEGGVSTTLAGVGVEAQKGLHIINKPVDVTGGGYYRVSAQTGTLAAALGAGSGTVGHLFSFRNPHATILVIPHIIKVRFQTLTDFTAATVTDLGFDLFRVTTFTTVPTTNRTSPTPSKMRASFGTTIIGATDINVATTVGMTGQIMTFDASPFAANIADMNQIANFPELNYTPGVADGYPLTLAQNEGFMIRNRGVWPAAGTGILQVEIGWAEVTAF